MLSLTLATLLVAAPSTTPITLAAPGLTVVGADPKLQSFYTDHLAQQLRFQGLQVTTSADIAAILGLERQRQLAGCGDDSCKAELAQALGADGLVLGTVTKLDRSWAMDLRVVASGDAKVLAQASSNSGDSDALVGTIAVLAEQLAKQVAAKLGRTLSPQGSTQIVRGPTKVRRLSWVPAVVGLAAVAVGGIELGVAKGTFDKLNTRQVPPLTSAQANQLKQEGTQQQLLGWVGLGVGAAGLVAAASMYLLGGDELITTGVAVAPGQVSLNVVGVFP